VVHTAFNFSGAKSEFEVYIRGVYSRCIFEVYIQGVYIPKRFNIYTGAFIRKYARIRK